MIQKMSRDVKWLDFWVQKDLKLLPITDKGLEDSIENWCGSRVAIAENTVFETTCYWICNMFNIAHYFHELLLESNVIT